MTRERRDKPYICVDVDLARNDRILSTSDPGSCLGLWVALTSYAREQLTTKGTSGRVPKAYADSLWGKQNAALLAEMCTVGLLEDDGTHYLVLRYAPRNQTRADAEAAKKSARGRMKTLRDVRANNARTNAERVANEERTNEEQSVDVPTSTSLSVVSDLPEGMQGERAARRMVPPAEAAGATPLPPDFLSAERRAYGEMLPLQDVDGVFRKFKQVRAESGKTTSHDWDATWQKFCDQEAKYQRSERERSRKSGVFATTEPARPPTIIQPLRRGPAAPPAAGAR